MGFPVGMQLATVAFGIPLTATGKEVVTTVSVKPTARVIWAATGQPLPEFTDSFTAEAGQLGSFQVPFVNQSGFIDSTGATVTDFAYQITAEWRFGNERPITWSKNLKPLVGQTGTIDLDLVPDGPVSIPVTAPTAAVLAFGGRTGFITLQESDLPSRLTPESLNATVSTEVSTTGHAARTALDALFASKAEGAANRNVVSLGVSNGTDDTSVLNGILATSAGARVRGVPGQNYLISAPLTLPSGGNVDLDFTGSTITLKSGSSSNMIQNYAYANTQRTVTDAAITSGTTTLTSATANFTSADVGRSVIVAGATSGAGPLCATITVFTNSTTVTVSVAATATVTGASAKLYTRDSDIVIRGGTWDRGANGGSVMNLHSLVFRRVDRLTIEKIRVKSTAGKYAIYPADVTECRIRDISLACQSDGVHVQGPARGVIIDGITGTAGDDCVAVGNTDYGYNDTFGDVTDLIISNVNCTKTNNTVLVKLYGAAGNGGVLGAANGASSTVFRNVRISGISGTGLTGPAISTDIDGFFDEITIDGVEVKGETHAVTLLSKDGFGTVRINNVGNRVLTSTNNGILNIPTGVTVDKLLIDGCSLYFAGTAGWMFTVNSGSTVNNMVVTGCAMKTTTGSAALVRIAGTVTSLTVSDCIGDLSGGNFINIASGGVCTTLKATSNWVTAPAGGSFMQILGTCSRAFLTANNCVSSSYGIGDIGSTTDIYLVNHSLGSGAGLNLRATAVVGLFGDGPLYTGGSALTPATAAGYALRVNHRAFQVDLSKITTKSAGDMAYNSNAGLSCGTGPVLTDGTTWKHMYSGATY